MHPALRGVTVLMLRLESKNLPSVFVSCNCRTSSSQAKSATQQKNKVTNFFKGHLSVPQNGNKLVEMLVNNVCHNKDGLIAVTKMPGIPVGGRLSSNSREVNIVTVIESLGDALGRPGLEIVKSAEKESTGLLLLAESKDLAREVQNLLKQDAKKAVRNRTYLTITKSIPPEKEGVINLPLEPKEFKGKVLVFPKPNPSKNSITVSKKVKTAKTFYKVISTNEELDCAFIEAQPQKLRKDQIQAHLASILCPVIGDHVYSSKVQTILGRKVLVDPHLASYESVPLPNAVADTLGIRREASPYLPLLLHWHQLTLPEWNGMKNYTITSPLPQYFMNALDLLGLEYETKEADNNRS